MSTYVHHNQNPFGRIIGDCAIRSLSQALDINYEEICKMMGKDFEDRVGLRGDVTFSDLGNFSKKYKLIKPVMFDNPFIDYVYKNVKYTPKYKWPSVWEYADRFSGRNIVLVRNSDLDMSKSVSRSVFKDTFHVLYVDCDRHEYYDNMRNDPGDMTVYGIFKIV